MAAIYMDPQKKKRKRRCYNCESCRLLKIKCDLQTPCSSCVKFNRVARCLANPPQPPSNDELTKIHERKRRFIRKKQRQQWASSKDFINMGVATFGRETSVESDDVTTERSETEADLEKTGKKGIARSEETEPSSAYAYRNELGIDQAYKNQIRVTGFENMHDGNAHLNRKPIINDHKINIQENRYCAIPQKNSETFPSVHITNVNSLHPNVKILNNSPDTTDLLRNEPIQPSLVKLPDSLSCHIPFYNSPYPTLFRPPESSPFLWGKHFEGKVYPGPRPAAPLGPLLTSEYAQCKQNILELTAAEISKIQRLLPANFDRLFAIYKRVENEHIVALMDLAEIQGVVRDTVPRLSHNPKVSVAEVRALSLAFAMFSVGLLFHQKSSLEMILLSKDLRLRVMDNARISDVLFLIQWYFATKCFYLYASRMKETVSEYENLCYYVFSSESFMKMVESKEAAEDGEISEGVPDPAYSARLGAKSSILDFSVVAHHWIQLRLAELQYQLYSCSATLRAIKSTKDTLKPDRALLEQVYGKGYKAFSEPLHRFQVELWALYYCLTSSQHSKRTLIKMYLVLYGKITALVPDFEEGKMQVFGSGFVKMEDSGDVTLEFDSFSQGTSTEKMSSCGIPDARNSSDDSIVSTAFSGNSTLLEGSPSSKDSCEPCTTAIPVSRPLDLLVMCQMAQWTSIRWLSFVRLEKGYFPSLRYASYITGMMNLFNRFHAVRETFPDVLVEVALRYNFVFVQPFYLSAVYQGFFLVIVREFTGKESAEGPDGHSPVSINLLYAQTLSSFCRALDAISSVVVNPLFLRFSSLAEAFRSFLLGPRPAANGVSDLISALMAVLSPENKQCVLTECFGSYYAMEGYAEAIYDGLSQMDRPARITPYLWFDEDFIQSMRGKFTAFKYAEDVVEKYLDMNKEHISASTGETVG